MAIRSKNNNNNNAIVIIVHIIPYCLSLIPCLVFSFILLTTRDDAGGRDYNLQTTKEEAEPEL